MHTGRQYNSTLGVAAKKGGMASAYQAQTGTKLAVGHDTGRAGPRPELGKGNGPDRPGP